MPHIDTDQASSKLSALAKRFPRTRSDVGKFPLETKIWSQMINYFLRPSFQTSNGSVDDAFDLAFIHRGGRGRAPPEAVAPF